MIRVVQSPFMVGRSEAAALSLPEDTMLSRLHFAIEYLDNAWMVRDLGSKNGTALNGKLLTQAKLLLAGIQ